MPSSRMLHCVALVKIDVLKELSASTLVVEALSSSETSVLTRATRRNMPDEGILHSYSFSRHDQTLK
jgi:hypothetical protein